MDEDEVPWVNPASRREPPTEGEAAAIQWITCLGLLGFFAWLGWLGTHHRAGPPPAASAAPQPVASESLAPITSAEVAAVASWSEILIEEPRGLSAEVAAVVSEVLPTRIGWWSREALFSHDGHHYAMTHVVVAEQIYERLPEVASDAELVQLSRHPDARIRLWAFELLLTRRSAELDAVLLERLNDETLVSYKLPGRDWPGEEPLVAFCLRWSWEQLRPATRAEVRRRLTGSPSCVRLDTLPPIAGE